MSAELRSNGQSPETDNRKLLQLIFSKNALVCMILGFSSGLPFFILVSLLPIWLRTGGVDLKTIGLFSLLMFPYNWKFLWSPLCDRFSVRNFGRRKTWMLGTQILLLVFSVALSFCNPAEDLRLVLVLAVAVALASATQDIAIDAYRREILSDRELGFGTSVHVNFYRLSQLVPGSLALILADVFDWQTAFIFSSAFLVPGVLLSVYMKEPEFHNKLRGFRESVTAPFREFFSRMGLRGAAFFLLFLFAYKLGDSMATALITPFYTDMGFSPTQIGTTAKIIGTSASITGALIGGIIMIKIGINRALWYFGFVQIVTILGFALLCGYRQNIYVLGLAVAGEYLGVGLGTASFTAFIARATNPAFTATQFALFTSIAALPRVLCNSFTGYMVETLGWFSFFCCCYVLAIPGMLLLFRVAPFSGEQPGTSGTRQEGINLSEEADTEAGGSQTCGKNEPSCESRKKQPGEQI